MLLCHESILINVVVVVVVAVVAVKTTILLYQPAFPQFFKLTGF